MENTMNKNRKYALVTGYFLVLMALLAGYVFGYAFPKLYNFNIRKVCFCLYIKHNTQMQAQKLKYFIFDKVWSINYLSHVYWINISSYNFIMQNHFWFLRLRNNANTKSKLNSNTSAAREFIMNLLMMPHSLLNHSWIAVAFFLFL